ncbi:MAG: DUF3307 domain-containing protein [Candidatus Peregrinibacteria bacterium]
MFTTLPFIVAHFLADFPLQTCPLADYKKTHFFGMAIHSLMHVVISAILLIPFLHEKKVWISILVIVIFHYLFDKVKIFLNQRFKVNEFLTYLFDQAAHLLIIILIAVYYLGPLAPHLNEMGLRYYTNPFVFLYFFTLIFCTYFYDVTRWVYRNTKKPHKYERDFVLIAKNALIVTLAFVVYWLTN